MFELSAARLSRLCIHLIDHESPSPQVQLSEKPFELVHNEVHDLVNTFMLSSFREVSDYKRFADRKDSYDDHVMYQLMSGFFDGSVSFYDMSTRAAQILLNASHHPGIKSGDLLIGLIEDIAYGDELIDAVAIIKSEQKQDFLKLLYDESNYDVLADKGISIDHLDKGCMIFNTRKADGFVVASKDKTAKNADAQYWNDAFLRIEYLDDAFHLTEQYLNMAQTYVSHQLGSDFEMNKGEQLGVLAEAGQFFKSNHSYDEGKFQDEVLGGRPDVIESFQDLQKGICQ